MYQRSLLHDGQVEPLADAVCVILEKVGVLVQNDDLLDALGRAGARVDRPSEKVTFPRKLVRDFADALSKENRKEGEEGFRKFPVTSLPTLGTQIAQFFHDYERKEKRQGNRGDFIALTKLGESLHRESGVGHSLLLTDVPALMEPLEAGLILAEYSSNPAAPFGWNVKQWDYLIEMGEILGRDDWVARGAICFAHPLRFDKDVADRFARQVKEGYGAGLTSMAVAGATAPVTVEGYVALAAAEHVATWLTARSLNPAAPLGGSMWAGTVDMRSGSVSYCSFDAMFYGFATCEFLRRWTGMNIHVGGGEYCDAREPGLYAAREKAYKSLLIAAFSGQHPEIGQGMLEDGKTLSPVQFLLERDLSLGIQHLGRELDITEENLGLSTTLDIGFGLHSNYVEADHTLRHFRSSLWLPEFIDRAGWNGPDHERAMLDRIQEKVNDLLA
ncbi:MAG: trimethylamine methyltransferase family protein, partial [Armatimonadetes bacterium]|nr:trimethylamine methyltransferase family protein [Armatimonadota bacterium]